MKNIEVKDLSAAINKPVHILKKYGGFIAVLLYLITCSLVVIRVDQLATREPTDDMINEKLTNIKRPKIDQASIDKLQNLQDRNIEVKSLFDEARNNPFSE